MSPCHGARRGINHLVLYISWATKSDPDFGRVKLAKTLFYCDLGSYAEQGAALTGAMYEHWSHGPFPPDLDALEQSLDDRKVAWVGRFHPRGKGEELKIVPNEKPTVRHIPEWDVWRQAFVDGWIAKISWLDYEGR